MIEGIRRSRVDKHVFRHNDPVDLERRLAALDPDRPKLVCSESVYSMDGDIAPLAKLCEVAERHAALTYLDEMHAVGLYGERGGGIAERDGVLPRIGVVQGTLAKPSARSAGTSRGRQRSSTPCAASRPASSSRRRSPRDRRRGTRERAASQGEAGRAPAAPGTSRPPQAAAGDGAPPVHAGRPSHIVPVLIGDAALCKHASDELLLRHRIYLQPLHYPTVAIGTERLRLTPSPLHEDVAMDELVTALQGVWARLSLPRP